MKEIGALLIDDTECHQGLKWGYMCREEQFLELMCQMGVGVGVGH